MPPLPLSLRPGILVAAFWVAILFDCLDGSFDGELEEEGKYLLVGRF